MTPAPERGSVVVLLFAIARERAGVPRLELTIPAGGLPLAQLLERVWEAAPALRPLAPHLRVAVDRDFVGPEAHVHPGAEVALIPPVSGGSGGLFRVVDRPLSLDEAVAAVQRTGAGAVVTFTGAVRDATAGREVVRLEYEAYAPMAESVLARLGDEVARRIEGARLAIVHRVGVLHPGELAVVIAAAAPHRAEAFEACRFAIEQLKQEVPIWKKEIFADGSVWVGMGP